MGLDDLLGSVTGGSGLTDLVGKFSENGLGDVVNSWVGRGSNLPVSADQISKVLGNDMIQNIAKKAGIDTGTASEKLAGILPQFIDQLTPNGKIDSDKDSGFDLSSLAGLLK